MSERSHDHGKASGFTPEGAHPEISAGLASLHFEVNPKQGRSTLLLPLGNTPVVDPLLIERLAAQGFTPKAEFHVTAFDNKPGSETAQIIHQLEEARQAELFDFIRTVAENDEWEVHPRNEFYAIKKQYAGEEAPRMSVIQIVDCPALDIFYEALNDFLPMGSELETPPAHITLATLGSPRGIGISKQADIQLLGRPIDIL